MKKLLFVSVFVASVCMYSCQKEEVAAPAQKPAKAIKVQNPAAPVIEPRTDDEAPTPVQP